MEAFAVLMIAFAVAAAVVAIIAAVVIAHENSHEGRVAQMQATHQESLRKIDKTAEYYVGLYSYIARRLDGESRRRQSG